MATPKFLKVKTDQLDDAQPLGRALVLLFGEFEREFFGELSKFKHSAKVTPSDHHVLRSIGPEGSTIVDIAKLNGVSKQSISKVVTSLQKRGLVTKSSHKKDARACLVRFTEQGLLLVEHALKTISTIEKRYQKIIGKNELVKMKSNLKALFDDHVLKRQKEF